MNVAFRVDASIDIGTGHVMRCLTLADALKMNGAQCWFVSREHPGHLLELIRQRGHRLIVLPLSTDHHGQSDTDPIHAMWLGCDWSLDANQTRTALANLHIEWLVVDHYALDARWEQALSGSCQALLVIDDLADRQHQCDLLLDQTLGRRATDYAGRVPKQCKLLLGSQYALLRPEFAALRQYSLKRRAHPQLKRVFINLGGIDKDNVTATVLNALENCSLPADIKLTVVLGSQAPWLEQVRSQAAVSQLNIEVLAGVSNMAALMSDADLVIGAAGSTSWERCCLGVPTIMLTLADNQIAAAQALADAQAVRMLEITENLGQNLREIMKSYIFNPENLRLTSEHARQICDGMGTDKVVLSMLNIGK